IIAAEGEHKASRALKEASDVISESATALQLRYLQTMTSISAEKNSTIVFPLPLDFMANFVTPSKTQPGGSGRAFTGLRLIDCTHQDALKEFLLLFGVIDRLPMTCHLDCYAKCCLVKHSFVKRRLPAHCLLLCSGCPMDSMFVLINGQLEVLALAGTSQRVPDADPLDPARAVRLTEFRDDCVIGVECLSSAGIVSPVTVRAVTDCILYELKRQDYHAMIRSLTCGMEHKMAVLLRLAHLPKTWHIVRSSLYDEMTLLEKYNAAHAIVRRLVVKKEVLLRQSQDPGALVMIEKGSLQIRYYKRGAGGKITEAKVNLSDGSVFGFKNFYSHILCLGQQLGRGGRLGQQYSSLVLPGLVIQARALEISEVVLLDAELFIRYSRRDPGCVIRSLLSGDQFARNVGAPEAEEGHGGGYLGWPGAAQLPADGLEAAQQHDDDGQEGLGAEQSDGEAEGAGMHRELAIDGPVIDGRDGPGHTDAKEDVHRVAARHVAHRAVGVGVADGCHLRGKSKSHSCHSPGRLVPRATKVMAVTASVRPTVQPKLDAKSPMTAVSMPMTPGPAGHLSLSAVDVLLEMGACGRAPRRAGWLFQAEMSPSSSDPRRCCVINGQQTKAEAAGEDRLRCAGKRISRNKIDARPRQARRLDSDEDDDADEVRRDARAVTLAVTPDFTPAFTLAFTPTVTPVVTPGFNPAITRAVTPGFTPTVTLGFTPGFTPAVTPTVTPAVTPTTVTPTVTPAVTPGFTPTVTLGFTPGFTPAVTPTVTPAVTPTTVTPTVTPAVTPGFTPTVTLGFTPGFTPAVTPTRNHGATQEAAQAPPGLSTSTSLVIVKLQVAVGVLEVLAAASGGAVGRLVGHSDDAPGACRSDEDSCCARSSISPQQTAPAPRVGSGTSKVSRVVPCRQFHSEKAELWLSWAGRQQSQHGAVCTFTGLGPAETEPRASKDNSRIEALARNFFAKQLPGDQKWPLEVLAETPSGDHHDGGAARVRQLHAGVGPAALHADVGQLHVEVLVLLEHVIVDDIEAEAAVPLPGVEGQGALGVVEVLAGLSRAVHGLVVDLDAAVEVAALPADGELEAADVLHDRVVAGVEEDALQRGVDRLAAGRVARLRGRGHSPLHLGLLDDVAGAGELPGGLHAVKGARLRAPVEHLDLRHLFQRLRLHVRVLLADLAEQLDVLVPVPLELALAVVCEGVGALAAIGSLGASSGAASRSAEAVLQLRVASVALVLAGKVALVEEVLEEDLRVGDVGQQHRDGEVGEGEDGEGGGDEEHGEVLDAPDFAVGHNVDAEADDDEQVEGGAAHDGAGPEVAGHEALAADLDDGQQDLRSRGPQRHQRQVADRLVPDAHADDLLAAVLQLHDDVLLLGGDHLDGGHEAVGYDGHAQEAVDQYTVARATRSPRLRLSAGSHIGSTTPGLQETFACDGQVPFASSATASAVGARSARESSGVSAEIRDIFGVETGDFCQVFKRYEQPAGAAMSLSAHSVLSQELDFYFGATSCRLDFNLGDWRTERLRRLRPRECKEQRWEQLDGRAETTAKAGLRRENCVLLAGIRH
uniref:Cyclic nucleotide-binding domain-containing protein n=1 Tax=Macrostomum lignano TaxID=282301 RepID=A0A1I8ITU7_9PLAT